jgi:hypothetical protein
MNSVHHAVVEVSADEITLRVNDRWLRFTASTMQSSDGDTEDFTLTEGGNVRIKNGHPEEMDMAAERLTRKMLHNG